MDDARRDVRPVGPGRGVRTQDLRRACAEQTIGGVPFVRLDVPMVEAQDHRPGMDAFCKLFGQGAVYCITPVSEEIARTAAARLRVEPVPIYMPELRQPERRALPEYEPDEEEEVEDPFSDQ